MNALFHSKPEMSTPAPVRPRGSKCSLRPLEEGKRLGEYKVWGPRDKVQLVTASSRRSICSSFCRPFTGTEDARIIELYNLRIPQTHIAKALNRSSSSLYARIGILRQLGLISRPQPRKQPALGASDKSTEPSPATITQDAQQTVASSSHSTLVPASSSSMAVPVSQAPVHDPQVGPSISDTTPSAPQNRSNSEAATRSKLAL